MIGPPPRTQFLAATHAYRSNTLRAEVLAMFSEAISESSKVEA